MSKDIVPSIEELKQYPIGLLPSTERGRDAMEFHAEFLARAYRRDAKRAEFPELPKCEQPM
jgi:hypothetical protein